MSDVVKTLVSSTDIEEIYEVYIDGIYAGRDILSKKTIDPTRTNNRERVRGSE